MYRARRQVMRDGMEAAAWTVKIRINFAK